MPVFSELDVLIASPSDVNREREVAVRVVEELNTSFLDCHRIRLRSRMWENDATPEMGDRAQAILNKQLGDSCDIFVGIMWSRIGTPTGEAESGTVEEFRRANARLQKNRSAVQILFFFSKRRISPNAIDVKQFAAVEKFRREIEQLGLISTFSSLEDFKLQLRAAIYKTAVELVNHRAKENAEPLVEPYITAEQDVRLSNAANESSHHLDIALAALNRIGQKLLEFLINTHVRTDELRELNRSEEFCSEKVNANFDLAAGDLESLCAELSREIPAHQKSFLSYLEGMSDLIVRWQDFLLDESHHADLKRYRAVVAFLIETMNSTAEKTFELVNVIVDVPRLTARFNGARRFACWTLSQFAQGIQEDVSLLETVRGQLDSLLNRNGFE